MGMDKRSVIRIASVFILLLILLMVDYYSFRIPPALEKADILIVEGWVPEDQLQKIPVSTLEAYDTLITTGVALPSYFIMPQRGSLIFKNIPSPPDYTTSEEFEIYVYASGSVRKKQGAGFMLYSDTTFLGTFITGPKKEAFKPTNNQEVRGADSLILRYFNDGLYRGRDKNLHIYGIEINDTLLSPYDNQVFYDRFDHDGKFRSSNGVYSYADLAASFLIQEGIGPEKICRVEAPGESRLRTLDSALGFREWVLRNDFHDLEVNILTTKEHSRKTYYTYRKLLREFNVEIGLLVIPGNPEEEPVSTRKNLIEYGAYLFYRLFVLPFH